MHSNHALEIKDVCQEDSGLYVVVLKNSAALLERRLNMTLVVNGMCLVFWVADQMGNFLMVSLLPGMEVNLGLSLFLKFVRDTMLTEA